MKKDIVVGWKERGMVVVLGEDDKMMGVRENSMIGGFDGMVGGVGLWGIG